MLQHTSKKLLVGLVTLTSATVLAACGANETTPNPAPEESVSSSTTTPEVSSESSADQASESSSAVSSDESQNTNDEASSQGIENQDYKVSLEQAIDIYNETYPDTTIKSISFDLDDGYYQYEVEGFNQSEEMEMNIDAMSGDILEKERETENTQNKTELDLTNLISPQEAMTAALKEIGSGYVEEWELETKLEKTYYEVEVENIENGDHDVDVYVDAKTGDIIDKD